MNRLAAIVFVGALMGVPMVSAFAQPGAAPAAKVDAPSPAADVVDPAAKEFISKFRAAVKDVHDLSCTASNTTVMGDEKNAQSGDLIAVFDRPASGRASLKKFRIASKSDGIDGVWAFDGKTSYKLDNTKKTFASMEAPEGQAFPAREVYLVIPSWIFGTDILSSKDAKIVGAKMLPDSEMDGVKCRGVEYSVQIIREIPSEEGEKKVEPLKMVMHQVRHVGADDLISRKIESTVTYSGGPEDAAPPTQTFTGVYTHVKVNTKPETDAFVLKPAEGYTTAKAAAEDLGIPSNDEEPKLKFAVGDSAPAFKLKDADDKDVTLEGLKGRVFLLDFWATWCGPCKMAMPGVQKLHEKYKDKQVSVYGVNTFEHAKTDAKKKELATKYMASKSYTYGLLLDGDNLAGQYGISGIPTFVLIGPDGKILYLGVGFDESQDEKLAELIDKTLAGK